MNSFGILQILKKCLLFPLADAKSPAEDVALGGVGVMVHVFYSDLIVLMTV